MRSAARSASATRFVIVLTGCLIVLLFFGALTARWFIVETPAAAADRGLALARQIATDVRDALNFQPTVTIRSRTVVESDAEVLQLVTLERPLTERYSWEHTWLGSRKRLTVEGDFLLRAGFDLSDAFVIDVDPDSREIHTRLPPTRVLSAELTDLRILADSSGWWNQLTPADRELAIAALRNRALEYARTSDLLPAARTSAEQRLERILATHGNGVFFDPSPTPLP